MHYFIERNQKRVARKPTYRNVFGVLRNYALQDVFKHRALYEEMMELTNLLSFRSVTAAQLFKFARKLLVQTPEGRKLLKTHKLTIRNWKGSTHTADRWVCLKPRSK